VSSREAKIKQDVKTRSKHSGEDVIYGMGGLIRTKYKYPPPHHMKVKFQQDVIYGMGGFIRTSYVCACTYIHTNVNTYIRMYIHKYSAPKEILIHKYIYKYMYMYGHPYIIEHILYILAHPRRF
jgi:hypothetical protein